MHKMIFEVSGENASWLEGKAQQEGITLNQLFELILLDFQTKCLGNHFKEPSIDTEDILNRVGNLDSSSKATKKKAKK